MPVLGCPSPEESWLESYPAKQGKVGRGGTPAREISFVSLVTYGPKVSDSALTMGGYSL